MGSSYLPPPEQNVVNVGDEISANALQALQNASPSPTSTNPVATNQSVATAIAAIPLPPPPDLTGYATQSWVTSQSYLTSSSLTGYATQSWVTSQSYATTSSLGSYAAKASTNAFSAPQIIDTTATTAALRVTQKGTGNAIEVEDSTTPDSTRFVVDQNGKVGIGGVVPNATDDKVAVHGGNIVFGWPYGVRFGDGTSIYSVNALSSQVQSSIQSSIISYIFSGNIIYSNTYTSYGSGTWYDSTYMYDISYTYVSYTAPIDVYWNASTASFSQNQGSPTYPEQGANVGSFTDGSGFTHTIYANGSGGVDYIS